MQIDRPPRLLVVAGVPIGILNMLNQYAPILLLSGAGHLSAFNPAQLQTLSMVFLDIYQHGIMVAEIFWGLWLIPLGILVYKSRFVPKVLGVLLIIGCFGHLLSFLSTFLFPDYSAILIPISKVVMIGEGPIFLWLLIKGAKDQQLNTTEPRNPILRQEQAGEVHETKNPQAILTLKK